MVTALDHYTTSFNWSEKNFFLHLDAQLVEAGYRQTAPSPINWESGLTMSDRWGLCRSDNAIGNWLVGLRDVVCRTDSETCRRRRKRLPSNAFGPVTPQGITCDAEPTPGILPVGRKWHQFHSHALQLRPAHVQYLRWPIVLQDSSAYLNIKAGAISDCTPDKRSSGDGVCDDSKYMYGHTIGLLQGTPNINKPNVKECYIPNADHRLEAGERFYYPPAFFSRNLVFRDVPISVISLSNRCSS